MVRYAARYQTLPDDSIVQLNRQAHRCVGAIAPDWTQVNLVFQRPGSD
jgi:hypothetical protein